MKIGIVIPLKAASVSSNWTTTCENLHATVKSVAAQTVDNFASLVVGHDKPLFLEGKMTNCDFVSLTEVSPPGVRDNEIQRETYLRYEADRCSKIHKGILELGKSNTGITHWFALDADDLIHREFVESLQPYAVFDAIIMDRGYTYFKNSGFLNYEDEFSAYCGSSAVLSDKLFKNQSDVVFGENFRTIPFGAISHVSMKSKLVEQGHSIAIPEKRLVTYVRDNGDNTSSKAYCGTFLKRLKQKFKMRMKTKPLTKSIKSDFGIDQSTGSHSSTTNV